MRTRSLLAAFVMSVGAATMALPAQAQSNAELALRVERLEAQIRELTGLIDALNYQVQQLQQMVNALLGTDAAAATPPAAPAADTPLNLAPLNNGDVQTQPLAQQAGAPLDLTQALTPGGNFNIGDPAALPAAEVPLDDVPPAAASGQPAPAVATTGNAQADYDAAYQYVLNGDYVLADQAFAAFLQAYPGNALTTDARFWRAESLFSRGMYRDAANQFYDAFVDDSDHPKAPDMLLKLGISLAQLGQTESACGVFEQVAIRYPDASNAMKQRVATEQANAGC